MPKRIMNIVGARPNMMKMGPLFAEMKRHPDLDPVLVHTGQHYDYAMSQVFLEQLGLPQPHYNLEVGSGSHHAQTAEIMKRFGELVQKDRPDMIVVVGDVNSTTACALVGAKEGIPVAHVESGLRSRDRSMPEEINRIVTDSISDMLFTTEQDGNDNLKAEGVAASKIFFVGNVMIDSLVRVLDRACASELVRTTGLASNSFGVLTLHRPANVDDPERLRAAIGAIAQIARRLPLIFPVHPRTLTRLQQLNIPEVQAWDTKSPIAKPGIWTIPPAAYIDFVGLVDRSAMVITDSGGIQEETTYLGVPCLTFRDNTERPVTVKQGTNRLIGTDPAVLVREASSLLDRTLGKPRNTNGYHPPELWDGHASERIVKIMRNHLGSSASA